MRIGLPIFASIAALIVAAPVRAQVVIDMPAPPAKPTIATSDEAANTATDISIAGYDTFEDEALYAPADSVALLRYAGYRNLPRVTSIPASSMYGGRSYYDFNGPWVYPPIWGWPFFFSNHGFVGFPGFGRHHFHHGFHHFGGFHGRFRFGGDHFRGHIRFGF